MASGIAQVFAQAGYDVTFVGRSQEKLDGVIAYITKTMTLEPGDLIATGTPAGVGVFRDPPVLLKAGDEVTIEIDGLGSLTNPVRAES
jgi:2-keto-4-pentenoate hydratase/2-oxohepta-3-ene-1,7-dioic acid hydratase in catechol pathway